MGPKLLKVILILSLVAPSQAYAVLDNEGESTTPQRPGGGAPARPSGSADPTCIAEVTRRHTEALRQCESRYGTNGATPNPQFLDRCRADIEAQRQESLANCQRQADANRRESESLRDTHKKEVIKNLALIAAESAIAIYCISTCCNPGPGMTCVPFGAPFWCNVGKTAAAAAVLHAGSFLLNRNSNESMIAGNPLTVDEFSIPDLYENPSMSPPPNLEANVPDLFGSNNALNPDALNQFPPEAQPYLSDLAKAGNMSGLDLSDEAAMQELVSNPPVPPTSGAGGGASAGGRSSSMHSGANMNDRVAAIKKNVTDKFGVSGVDFEDGGGGGGGFGRSGGGSGNPLDGLFGNEKREEGNVNGLTRTLASGESVGVAGDDLFGMVSRRYQTRHRAGSFLPPNAPASTTRRN